MSLTLQHLDLTDEVVSVCALSIMPGILGVLVQEHTVHGGPRIRLTRCPLVEGHCLEMMLGCPHPLATAGNVVTTGPPAFGDLIV